MSVDDREKQFVETVREILEWESEGLDGPTRTRLVQMRYEAVQEAGERRRGFFSFRRWAAVSGLASAAAAALVIIFWLNTSPGDLPVRQEEDFELITSKEQIDFYANLDFYRWLAANKR